MVLDSDVAFLHELLPTAEKLLNRHFEKTEEWHPHVMVPWSRGKDFGEDYVWSPEEAGLPEEVRSALFVNLLTEDNLPYYFRDIERMFGRDGAWGEWVRRWTAEEARHATVIRDYLTITRAIDPVGLERGRMAQMGGGQVPEPPTAAAGMCYVTLQELATRISHRNTGARIDDKVGYDILRRVAIDENFHFLFYRDIATEGFNIDPSTMVLSLEPEVVNFAMPGTGIPDYAHHARLIAKAGIYDLAVHYDQILDPIVMRHWNIESLEGLTPEADQSRERLVAFIKKSGRIAQRMKDRRNS